MTSILDRHASDTYQYHTCGGTVLSGPDHVYCDRCGAVAYYGEDLDEQTWDEARASLDDLGEGEDNLDN